jgi:hypothetical protein
MELTPKFIKMRNSVFSKRERDIIRLALMKELNEWLKAGTEPERIAYLERLISKFNDGKNFK